MIFLKLLFPKRTIDDLQIPIGDGKSALSKIRIIFLWIDAVLIAIVRVKRMQQLLIWAPDVALYSAAKTDLSCYRRGTKGMY